MAANLEAQVKGMVCVRCGEEPRVAWGGSHGVKGHVLRCECGVDKAVLTKRTPYIKERMGKMVDTAMANRPNEIPLSLDEIKGYINPDATEREAYIFLKFCQIQGLNPFVGEAHLVKYDASKPAAFVVGIQAYLKRAAADSHFCGYDAGVIVTAKTGEVIEREGSFMHPGDVLLGAWAEIDLDNRTKPLKVTVNLREYDKHQSTWKTMPATMIEKTAIVQGLRRAIPAVQEMHDSTQGLDISVEDMPEPQAGDTSLEGSTPAESEGQPEKIIDQRAAPTEVLPGYNKQSGKEPAHTSDWLKTCPKHQVVWTESRYGWQHKDRDSWCKRKKIITEAVVHRVKGLADAAGITDAGLNDWYKTQYDGRTRSALGDEELLGALDAFGNYVTMLLEEKAKEGEVNAEVAEAKTESPAAEGPSGEQAALMDGEASA